MCGRLQEAYTAALVSMKSGLEGRNNPFSGRGYVTYSGVSMKSGLEGRNNCRSRTCRDRAPSVSMKSGLEGRNNVAFRGLGTSSLAGSQ